VSTPPKTNPRRYRRVIYNSNPHRGFGSWGLEPNVNTSRRVIAKQTYQGRHRSWRNSVTSAAITGITPLSNSTVPHPVETFHKAPAAGAQLHLSNPGDPARRLEGVGLPRSVRLKASLPLWLPGSKTLFPDSKDRTPTLIYLRAQDRPQTQTRKTQLQRRLYGRTESCSNTISPSKPIPGMSKRGLYRNRSGLALRQFRKWRVHPFPQCHRYLLHSGRNPCRHGYKVNRGENGDGLDHAAGEGSIQASGLSRQRVLHSHFSRGRPVASK
jgi:hypothetical protein